MKVSFTVATPTADLSVTKSDEPDPVGVGYDLTYRLVVANIGSCTITTKLATASGRQASSSSTAGVAAGNVELTDELPTPVTFVSATPSQGSCSGTSSVTCSLGTINSGASADVTIVVTPQAGAVPSITNTASVTGAITDTDPANNSDTESTTVMVSVNPTRGAVHTPVTITGEGFGSTQGTSTVTIGGLPAIVLSWSNTEIIVRVPVIPTPNGADTPADVVVTVDGRRMTGPFTVARGIAFVRDVGEEDSNFEIYVMNPDGSGQTRLTDNPAYDDDPAWSPDGTKIVFGSDRDGDGEIYVMNADGSGQTNLTNHLAWDEYPAWR